MKKENEEIMINKAIFKELDAVLKKHLDSEISIIKIHKIIKILLGIHGYLWGYYKASKCGEDDAIPIEGVKNGKWINEDIFIEIDNVFKKYLLKASKSFRDKMRDIIAIVLGFEGYNWCYKSELEYIRKYLIGSSQ
jgi:hypothetical protein